MDEIGTQIAVTTDYLQHLKYSGLMEAEWKRDPRDGSFKLLEINARQSMQSILPSKCGVNLILIAYLDLTGQKIKNVYNYKKGVKWADSLLDLISALETHVSLGDWIRSISHVEVWSYFAADDLVPWMVSNFETVRRIVTKLQKRSLD